MARKKSGRTAAQRIKGGRRRAAAKSSTKAKKGRGTRVAAKSRGAGKGAGKTRNKQMGRAASIRNYSLHIEKQVRAHFGAIVRGLVSQAELGRTTATKLLFRWGGMEAKLRGDAPAAQPTSLAELLKRELEKRQR